MSDQTTPTFEGPAIVELFGHRRIAGFVSECEIAGHGFLRVEAFSNGVPTTQFYAPSAVYGITPCSEEIAREIGAQGPKPVESWAESTNDDVDCPF